MYYSTEGAVLPLPHFQNGATAQTDTYAYTYDTVGRIRSIAINGVTQYSYQYDTLGQLVRENNKPLNQTVLYTYDNNANLLSKTVYAYTTTLTLSGTPLDTVTYTYGNLNRRNLLTAYDGEAITYDAIGNPLTYRGMTMTWTQGRRLTTLTDGTQSLSYTYNDEGIRTSKTVNGVKHTYTVSGSQIRSEEWTENGLDHLILYIYDASGAPIGMQYRNSGYIEDWFDSYLFRKNIQGDIIGVYNESGTLLVSYTYDAWGNQTVTYNNGGASTTARYNPFRYRGYFYDTEIDLYYLQSRYYDSRICKFINADDTRYLVDSSSIPDYLQDCCKCWWYFYWGTKENNLKMYLGFNVKSYYQLDFLYARGNIYSAFSSVKKFLSNRDGFFQAMTGKTDGNKDGIKYAFDLTNALYLIGDFSNCLSFFRTQKGRKYNLYNNNCMQVVLRGIVGGTFNKYFLSYSNNVSIMKYFQKISRNMIPNEVYKFMVFRVKREGVGFEAEGRAEELD